MAATPGEVAQLATRRAQMIAWLHDYYEAGVYPTDAAGRPISVFEDDKGVRCPMAELIYRSGRADLVAAVKRDNNAVRLADVKTGPLHEWMLASGLTIEEIAMVQGAMDIDYAWMQQELPVEKGPTILAASEQRYRFRRVGPHWHAEVVSEPSAAERQSLIARGQVRGRLETAERALRDGTQHGLFLLASR